jgi:hypothetical protein
MNQQELEAKVKELLDEVDNEVKRDFFNSEVSDNEKWDSDELSEFRSICASNGITFQHVTNHGGEGESEDYWSVYSFSTSDHVVFVKFYGWYQSYNGSEYEDFKLVKPVDRMVTFYE